MLDLNKLPDANTLDDIKSHFKVYAGPGAGKTTWLISHLERVLKNSERLGKTGKIACITYTNVAADEITERLECDKSRFDISTIHSFLYRNIVKPFSYLIKVDQDGNELFNISNLNGHDEHVIHGTKLRRWVHTIGQNNGKSYSYLLWSQNKQNVVSELSSLGYEFNDKDIELTIRQHRGARIPKSNGELWLYKSKYWLDGIMHHEDVLYFSYLILSQNPRVIDFVRNRFPYIFVDEFQDTTQLQTWIINKISQKDTIVGVVGDLAQSIYKFAGAERSDFLSFKKDEASAYKLRHNHRSTNNIVDFLNLLRDDIQQSYGDNKPDGVSVKILVGSIEAAKNWVEASYPEEPVFILTRKNSSVSEINSQLDATQDDLINEMYSSDSNGQRAKLIHSIIKGLKLYDKHDFANSLKEILRPLKRKSNGNLLKLDLKEIAITIINGLKLDNNREQTICDFYLDVRRLVSDKYGFTLGSNLRSGKAKTFYDKHTINDLLPHVKVDTRSDDKVRTIHSAKGAEFENVLVHFETVEDFRKYILNAPNNLHTTEDDCRIYYVASSRAKNKLLINIPEASQDDFELIQEMNMTFEAL